MNQKISEQNVAQDLLATGKDLSRGNFPSLTNVSAAHIYRFVPRPTRRLIPEFVFIPFELERGKYPFELKEEKLKIRLLVAQWSFLWEAGQLRPEFLEKEIPSKLKWLKKYKNTNLYLIPDMGEIKYDAYKPLYHLLPKRTLERWGLPLIN